MLPLVLLIIFSPMVYQPVKLSLQTAIIISILVSFVVDLITTRGVKDSIGRTKAVYEGMAKYLHQLWPLFAALNSSLLV